ncbi:FMN-binding protein [Microbacterium sp. NEAU-LLC]|uniref:FMN-binding protein n=1 Tax=Microbacterium helvum TaxID=2773713 RepID=A0ABR8NQI5_9MICO|nr:FMN-binding protein [Microbacterium helvum]MBD3942419.1 FMN-binding protein [Microbacterium helvum]
MIRTALASHPVRVTAAFGAAAGIVLLAGCAPAASEAEEPATGATSSGDTSDTGDTAGDGSTGTGSTGSTGSYADGTYTAEGTYATPESVETISVTVTLQGDVVTDVEVTGNPQKRESEEYQGKFIGGIAAVVVGQDIDELQVSRVAGSSLTSDGFNKAIETIKSEAAS